MCSCSGACAWQRTGQGASHTPEGAQQHGACNPAAWCRLSTGGSASAGWPWRPSTSPRTPTSCATTWARCTAARLLPAQGLRLPWWPPSELTRRGTQYECRLCLTLHNNEGNYLAHTQVGAALMPPQPPLACRERAICTVFEPAQLPSACRVALPGRPACVRQGKRHQQNLAKRAAREAAEKPMAPAPQKRGILKNTGASPAGAAACSDARLPRHAARPGCHLGCRHVVTLPALLHQARQGHAGTPGAGRLPLGAAGMVQQPALAPPADQLLCLQSRSGGRATGSPSSLMRTHARARCCFRCVPAAPAPECVEAAARWPAAGSSPDRAATQGAQHTGLPRHHAWGEGGGYSHDQPRTEKGCPCMEGTPGSPRSTALSSARQLALRSQPGGCVACASAQTLEAGRRWSTPRWRRTPSRGTAS